MAEVEAMIISGVILAMLFVSQPAAATEFFIKVSGSPAIQFRGDCRVVNHAGKTERVKFRGSIPKVYSVEATAVSCTIQKWDVQGRLKVKLLKGRRVVARSETAAAFNWVRVRTSGPWGKARGKRGTQGRIVIQTGPRKSLIPPLSPKP